MAVICLPKMPLVPACLSLKLLCEAIHVTTECEAIHVTTEWAVLVCRNLRISYIYIYIYTSLQGLRSVRHFQQQTSVGRLSIIRLHSPQSAEADTIVATPFSLVGSIGSLPSKGLSLLVRRKLQGVLAWSDLQDSLICTIQYRKHVPVPHTQGCENMRKRFTENSALKAGPPNPAQPKTLVSYCEADENLAWEHGAA